MHLKYLFIDSHRHLEDLEFNFRYPQGHKLEGQPLKKICFIGQSATGKTSILEIIKDSLNLMRKSSVVTDGSIYEKYELPFVGKMSILHENYPFSISNNEMQNRNSVYKNTGPRVGGTVSKFIEEGLKIIYLRSDLVNSDTIRIFNENPIQLAETLPVDLVLDADNMGKKSFLYEFGKEENLSIWLKLLLRIIEYRKEFLKMASTLISNGTIGDFKRLHERYIKWEKENENPIKPFADKINPLLEKLNLAIDLTNTEYPVPFKSILSDNIIPITGLSTGTKGMMLSLFPLSELDTDESIILIDEPERSLFPDIQIELMSIYESLAPKAQIIVATHSPFIASAFEPEERFILYFDSNGKVAVRNGQMPIGDDPNDIIANDFNVNYYNKYGKAAYAKYLDLKHLIIQEVDENKKRELLLELVALGDKYNF